VSRINVLVAATSPDLQALGIVEAVASRADMNLLQRRVIAASEVDALLASIPRAPRCALVVVGHPDETGTLAAAWLAKRADVVVMHVEVIGDIVRIAVRASTLDPLLTALRDLVERVALQPTGQVVRMTPRPAQASLLDAAIDWVHARLREAVESVSDDNGDVHGLSITRATLLQSLEAPAGREENADAGAALDLALAAAGESAEPLAVAVRTFDLTPLELRMLLLTLAPELDLRFQRCVGFLLDDMGRRSGTPALYSTLLGPTARVRGELAQGGALARWLVFDGQPAADDPLRVDPYLAQWILGDRMALANEPRVRRVLRLVAWPGASVLRRDEERFAAAALIDKLRNAPRWILLGGADPAAHRALIELGAEARDAEPTRVELARLGGTDIIDVEDCARRVARMAQLTALPLVIDATRVEETDGGDDSLRLFFATLERLGCRGAVISREPARVIRLFGAAPYELDDQPALSRDARVAALRGAAAGAGASMGEETAEALAMRYPLGVDGLEHAMRLASSRPPKAGEDDPRLAGFTAACREVAAEGVSHLAEAIEPVFDLDNVVLPADRKQQLLEIVDHVRFAPQVLDDWKFRDQLPYGRGVAALFHGPSGTGKTMAAMGVAHRLGIQLLRLDFSRVVSKYIGDTEKNIDRVFTDAGRSGAAILIDEADALLGKRSEVKDAHDRYANIEVAYLLQRMETFEGLAILTTNLRQNLDPSFLRRLRFVVDFPRPDAEARLKIWQQCLPEGSHELDEAEFRQLARKIDMPGGNIRQITLRAAFIAAAAGTQIDLTHIARAARAELAKVGMPPVELDLSRARRAA